MFNRKVTLVAGMLLAASVAALGQSVSGNSYLFQLPGQNSTSAQIIGYPYTASPLTSSISTLGPNGAYQVVPKPDGSGFYVLGATLQVANSTFTSFTTINGIAATPTVVATSPDGNYAVVGAGDVYILSASTGAILLDTSTSGTVVGIAISQDSQNAYVLSNVPYGSLVTQINLNSKAKVGSALQLTGDATSIAFSPLGLLYVGAVNRVFEINPATLTVTPNGTMTPNATPGPLEFTPDGSTLYFLNETSNVTGASMYQVTLATYSIAGWPSNGTTPIPLDAVFVAGNGRIFAVSYSEATLYDVATSPLTLSISSLSSVVNVQAVSGAAISNELPSSLYLYLLISNTGQPSIYRINLASNQIGAQGNAATTGGVMEFVGVPPQTGAASFLTYNNNQTVAQGATSLPLVAQVLDLTGRPVFNLPVSFTTVAGNGIVINTPNPTTNANGYVQTTITAPATQGSYTITLTAGTANTSFTINVPGQGGSSGTGTGGVSQVSIVTGNGQLVEAGYSTNLGGAGDELTVLVTDVNGVPLAGVGVTFSVTSGTGGIATFYNNDNSPGAVTDAYGRARCDFVAGIPADDDDFETDTVVASTPYGTVSFTEIEYASIIQGSPFPAFPPGIILEAPTVDNNRTVTVAEGSVAQNAVVALISASSSPQAGQPIPGVAIRIIDPNNSPAASPYASCQGSTLSDQTGTAHCSVVATCGNGLGSFPVGYMVGDYVYYQGTVIVTQGVAQNLSILAGNNQSGPAGKLLPLLLRATITDSCGVPVPGAQVAWTVTQGSATLSNIVSVSGSSGQVSAAVTFGTAAGTVIVTASLGTSSVVTYSLTSQAVAANMTITGGNNQTATVGAAFSQPLTVQLQDANGNAVTGVPVTFAVTSGAATLSATSVVTNAQGGASTTATASSVPGAIVVTASYGTVSASFSLTAAQSGPTVTATSFQNAASFQAGLVPCGLATATGTGLAAGITGTVSGATFFGPLPYTLDGLSLSVNGTPAPIYQLSNTNGKQQVTFQTPCEVAPTSSGTVVIQVNGGTTTVSGVPILVAQPGIFFYTGTDGFADGYVISATDGSFVTASNPAKRGQNYYLIATGLGQVTPATATDSAGVSGQTVNYQVIVGVSNLGVPVFSQTYQPGEIGIYAIGFTIPLTNPAGTNQPLALAVVANGQTIFASTVYLPSVQ